MEKPTLQSGLKKTAARNLSFDVGSLNEYTGAWDTTEIVHLLKRTVFGAMIDDINHFRSLTMSQAVDELLTPTAAPATTPLNNYSSDGYTDPTGVTPWAS